MARRQSSSPDAVSNKTHTARLMGMWVPLMVVTELVFWFVLQPHIPPGRQSDSAQGQQFDITVLSMIATPVFELVIMYFIYSLLVWRHPKGAPLVDGPPIRSNMKIQTAWMVITSAMVFGAFVFGTYELVVPAGAGGGEGPNPIWKPSGKVLPVQVIAQQWRFTYRYPTLGGFETSQLVIPNHTEIAFHVTSLDVVHNFWAYQLGVKADANPQSDNVAYTHTNQVGRFTVRCAELCGIWHGAMYNYGHVVPRAQFSSWATSTKARLASNTKNLPPFSYAGYVPSANGAAGSFYSPQDKFGPLETYGAATPTS